MTLSVKGVVVPGMATSLFFQVCMLSAYLVSEGILTSEKPRSREQEISGTAEENTTILHPSLSVA